MRGSVALRISAGAMMVGAMVWLAAVAVLVARPSVPMFSWVLFFAGTLTLGLAVVTADDPPKRAGGLLILGSLLVLSSIWTFLGGGARRSELVSPLVGEDGGTLVLALLLWSALGAGWAWLGGALWVRTHQPGGASGSGP